MLLVPASIAVLFYTLPSTSLVSAQLSSSTSYSLSNDTTSYIPACAQPCFQSFIETNFPTSLCTSSPSLNCLCSHNSTSGYSLGEGALQCILAEQSINACQGVSSSNTVILNALNMCVGRPGAIPNAHSIITATLVVPSSAPTVVLNVATGRDESVPATTTSASIPSATSSAVRKTSSSMVSITPGNTIRPNATAPAASETAQSSAEPTGLTTAQVSGIVVGSASLAILAISGLVIFICVRRRGKGRRDNESDFGTFHEEHGNSMEQMFQIQGEKKNLPFRPGGTVNGVAAKTRPAIPPRVITDPHMFSRTSIPPDQIGIALSPELGFTPDSSNPPVDHNFEPKHSSKLLPEKPSFPIEPLKASPLPPLPPESAPHPHWRPQIAPGRQLEPISISELRQRPDSEVTAFEEDTPAGASSQPDVSSHSIYGLDYYNEGHNWRSQPLEGWRDDLVPRASTAPIEAVIRPLEVRKAQSNQNFSQPIRPLTAASSVYSAGGISGPVPELPRSGSQRIQDSQAAESYQQYVYNPYVPDNASVTTIESSTGDYEPRNVVIPPPELSPVVESPVGKSPVSYPRIPARLSDEKRYWVPPQEWDSEPRRRPEIRAKSRKEESNGLKISMNGTSSPPKNARSAKSTQPTRPYPSMDSEKIGLAKRRGDKLAPALDFTKQRSNRRPQETWRVVSEDHEMGAKEMTPTKIGNELYLNVQNI